MQVYEHLYGTRPHAPIVPLAAKLLASSYSPTRDPVRILDIGCGNMAMSRALAEGFQAAAGEPRPYELEGWDVSHAAVAAATKAGYVAHIRDITEPLHAGEENKYDVIFFLEVLEHLVDTDTAIQHIRQLLSEDGVMVLSTPNLAAWYNRLFLLVGRQPHCTEVSFAPYRFGNRIVHRILGDVGGTNPAAGHLRVFTWKALKEFLNYHGMTILSARGCANHRYDLVSKLVCLFSIGLAGDLCIVARKSATNPGAETLTLFRTETDSP